MSEPFPAATMTTRPCDAIRLATTEPMPSVHPSTPPKDKVITSIPSLYALINALTMTSNKGTDTEISIIMIRQLGGRTSITGGSVTSKHTISTERGFVRNTADPEYVTGICTYDAGRMGAVTRTPIHPNTTVRQTSLNIQLQGGRGE